MPGPVGWITLELMTVAGPNPFPNMLALPVDTIVPVLCRYPVDRFRRPDIVPLLITLPSAMTTVLIVTEPALLSVPSLRTVLVRFSRQLAPLSTVTRPKPLKVVPPTLLRVPVPDPAASSSWLFAPVAVMVPLSTELGYSLSGLLPPLSLTAFLALMVPALITVPPAPRSTPNPVVPFAVIVPKLMTVAAAPVPRTPVTGAAIVPVEVLVRTSPAPASVTVRP